ncbi:MAG: mandelate racemase/muconate lactonizing enzyme family protein [Bryobacteraceae bacterium]|nr:mandelate racemase/muconate lactonizing enzyme family protein [Bryobacteraceae bacterium]
MKITRLSWAVIEANYDWTIVRLDGEDGHYGLGEAYMGPGLTAILRELRPLVVGADAFQIEQIVRRLRGCTVHASPGVCYHAIAGIEAALWDLLGKATGQPVWKLLGGTFRQRVRVYADCHAGDALDSMSAVLQSRKPSWSGESPSVADISLKHHGWDPSETDFAGPDKYRARAAEMAERGFSALKFDADIPTPFPTDTYNRSLRREEIDYVYERLRAVRDSIGPGVDLAVDCHWNYTTADAIRLGRALGALDLLWLEDPIPPESVRQLRAVQADVPMPVATGENQYLLTDFLRLIEDGEVRVLAPDLQKIGALDAKALSRTADAMATSLAIHNISSPIGTIFSAHCCATIPNFLALEWHGASVPFWDHLLPEPLIVRGEIELSHRPGLGVTLNEDVAYRYRKMGEEFFA